jgi:DNA polymerase
MSLMSREDMLRELELLPVWQLRQPLPAPLKATVAPADVSPPAVAVPESVVSELPAMESRAGDAVPESVALEPISSQGSQQQKIEVAGSFEVPVIETVQEAVSEQVQSLPLRLLLSEDGVYAFLIEPYAAEPDAQPVETLLRNMIRAMQLDSRVDITDSADKVLAGHDPQLIISLGAEPANRLLGKVQGIDSWRNGQQQNPPLYAGVPLIVTYHPAHLLENTADKAGAWRDLCFAMKLIQRL